MTVSIPSLNLNKSNLLREKFLTKVMILYPCTIMDAFYDTSSAWDAVGQVTIYQITQDMNEKQ